jgi:hypothetical protein
VNRGLTGRVYKNDAHAEVFGIGWRPLAEAAASRSQTAPRAPVSIAGKFLDFFVRSIDAYMRRCQGIIEFTDNEQCILRISFRRARKGERFFGGRLAANGEWVGELHLWNEHIPPMSPGGADMAWATTIRRRLRLSLIILAQFIQSDPRFSNINVFCGETAFASGKCLDHTRGLASFFGFEITENRRSSGFWGWWERLGEAIYLWGMVRTFNPGALKVESLMKPAWFQFWLRRETLIETYATLKAPEPQFVRVPELIASAGRRAA